ncbi:hypothetical protein C8J57DRAFT_1363063 [Mycena rebaudengoi]|nr:hypothetical protein C8J57DRAFT_1363063 [Mycena rebaudengoi]
MALFTSSLRGGTCRGLLPRCVMMVCRFPLGLLILSMCASPPPQCANLFTHSCDYNPPLRHIHLAPRLPATLNSGHLASGSRASAAPRELQLRLRHLTPHLSVCHSSTPITRSSTEKGGVYCFRLTSNCMCMRSNTLHLLPASPLTFVVVEVIMTHK